MLYDVCELCTCICMIVCISICLGHSICVHIILTLSSVVSWELIASLQRSQHSWRIVSNIQWVCVCMYSVHGIHVSVYKHRWRFSSRGNPKIALKNIYFVHTLYIIVIAWLVEGVWGCSSGKVVFIARLLHVLQTPQLHVHWPCTCISGFISLRMLCIQHDTLNIWMFRSPNTRIVLPGQALGWNNCWPPLPCSCTYIVTEHNVQCTMHAICIEWWVKNSGWCAQFFADPLLVSCSSVLCDDQGQAQHRVGQQWRRWIYIVCPLKGYLLVLVR